MSGNGLGYSEFKEGNVLPNPPVKGTEGGSDQNALKSNQVGGKKKGKRTMKGGNCGLKSVAPSMNGGKKKKCKTAKKSKTAKKRRMFFFW